MSGGDYREHLDLLNRVHFSATGQILDLMDGFYSNIEEGLFELAHSTGEDEQRRRCFDLMRELRFRKSGLLKNFSRTLDRYRVMWFSIDKRKSADGRQQESGELQRIVDEMASKSFSHFNGVLTLIAERASDATGNMLTAASLPISPINISKAFVSSCRSLKMDTASIEIVQNLFSRFVLDSLGSVYGEINKNLSECGYKSISEQKLEQVSRA